MKPIFIFLLKEIIFLFSFFIVCVGYGQEALQCGFYNHSTTHTNDTPDDTSDDLIDPESHHCYTNDIGAPLGKDLTDVSFPILDADYVPTEIIIDLEEGILLDFAGFSSYQTGRFGIAAIDDISVDEGILKIIPLSDKLDNTTFLLEFAHPKNITNLIGRYQDINFDYGGQEIDLFNSVEPNDLGGVNSIMKKNNLPRNLESNIYQSKKLGETNTIKNTTNYPTNFFKKPNDHYYHAQWSLHN